MKSFIFHEIILSYIFYKVLGNSFNFKPIEFILYNINIIYTGVVTCNTNTMYPFVFENFWSKDMCCSKTNSTQLDSEDPYCKCEFINPVIVFGTSII